MSESSESAAVRVDCQFALDVGGRGRGGAARGRARLAPRGHPAQWGVAARSDASGAGVVLEPQSPDQNAVGGVSNTVQEAMASGVDAATAAAMEYANYLDYQRGEGWKD